MPKLLPTLAALLVVNAVASPLGVCDEPTKPEPSTSDVAAELADPNTALGTINLYLDTVSATGDLAGADGQHGTNLIVQPILPFPVGDHMNLIVRPTVPIVFSQPVPLEGGGFEHVGFNLDEIGFDIALGKSFKSGFGVAGGVNGTLPTATDDALGKGQWALGPELYLWVRKPWGVVNLLLTQQWDVAGGDPGVETDVTAGEYSYTINFKDGWQITSNPTFSYDHTQPSGENWTFPLGTGLSKTVKIGPAMWQFGFEYWKYLAQPSQFGPDWQLRLTVIRVVKLH
jgi:hypothetical protein